MMKPPADLRSVTLRRAGHTYVFRWREGEEAFLCVALLGAAADPHCPLTARDAWRALASALGPQGLAGGGPDAPRR